jgi:hypothetical protein
LLTYSLRRQPAPTGYRWTTGGILPLNTLNHCTAAIATCAAAAFTWRCILWLPFSLFCLGIPLPANHHNVAALLCSPCLGTVCSLPCLGDGCLPWEVPWTLWVGASLPCLHCCCLLLHASFLPCTHSFPFLTCLSQTWVEAWRPLCYLPGGA